MTVLGDDALRHALVLGVFVIVFVPVQEHDRVGVLLDGAGFPEVGQNRPLVGAALHRTGQLAQADYRHVQLLRHDFQGAGNFAHHGNTVVAVLSVAGTLHQL